jgi:hypothetical protein
MHPVLAERPRQSVRFRQLPPPPSLRAVLHAHRRTLLWLAWSLPILVALVAGWVTARGSGGVRALVAATAVVLVGYLYLRLHEGSATPDGP